MIFAITEAALAFGDFAASSQGEGDFVPFASFLQVAQVKGEEVVPFQDVGVPFLDDP